MATKRVELISLFEYLGYHSSLEQRQQIYNVAIQLKEPTRYEKDCSGRHKKTSFYFRREFLDEYFKSKR